MRRLALLVTALVPAAACGHSTDPADRPVGTYVLRTVNGHPAAEAWPSTAGYAADTVTVAGDGTWRRAQWHRTEDGPPYLVASAGTWTVGGGELRMRLAPPNTGTTYTFGVAEAGRVLQWQPVGDRTDDLWLYVRTP